MFFIGLIINNFRKDKSKSHLNHINKTLRMGFGFSSCCTNVDKPKKKFVNQS